MLVCYRYLFSTVRLPLTWLVRPPRPHPSSLPRALPRWLHTHTPWPLRHRRHIPRSLIPPISFRPHIHRPIRARHHLLRSLLPRPLRRLRPGKMALLTTPSSTRRKVNTQQGEDSVPSPSHPSRRHLAQPPGILPRGLAKCGTPRIVAQAQPFFPGSARVTKNTAPPPAAG